MITVGDYRSQTPGYSSNADRNKGETTFLFSVNLCLLLFVINIIITIIVTIIINIIMFSSSFPAFCPLYSRLQTLDVGRYMEGSYF